jgi:hypothetical protein
MRRSFHIAICSFLLLSLSGLTVLRAYCAYEMAKPKKHSCCPNKQSEPLKIGLCCQEQPAFTLSDTALEVAKVVDVVLYETPFSQFIFLASAPQTHLKARANAPPNIPKRYLAFQNFRN